MEDLIGCFAFLFVAAIIFVFVAAIGGCVFMVADNIGVTSNTHELKIVNKHYNPPGEDTSESYVLTFYFPETECNVSESVSEQTYNSVSIDDSLRVNICIGRFSGWPYAWGVQN